MIKAAEALPEVGADSKKVYCHLEIELHWERTRQTCNKKCLLHNLVQSYDEMQGVGTTSHDNAEIEQITTF